MRVPILRWYVYQIPLCECLNRWIPLTRTLVMIRVHHFEPIAAALWKATAEAINPLIQCDNVVAFKPFVGPQCDGAHGAPRREGRGAYTAVCGRLRACQKASLPRRKGPHSATSAKRLSSHDTNAFLLRRQKRSFLNGACRIAGFGEAARLRLLHDKALDSRVLDVD
jgi:hypothetical protein